MKVSELRAKLEVFLADLEKHAQLWRRSLDDTIPQYPIVNGDLLRQQSNKLARQLGALRPYIDRFGLPSTMTAAGREWDIYDSAVAIDVAIRKGYSLEGVFPQIQQMLGRLDAMNANSEFGGTTRSAGAARTMKLTRGLWCSYRTAAKTKHWRWRLLNCYGQASASMPVRFGVVALMATDCRSG